VTGFTHLITQRYGRRKNKKVEAGKREEEELGGIKGSGK
jgi:hypothetical protein